VPYTVGINKIENESFELYPNPTNGVLFIKTKKSSKETTTINLIDLSGKILLSETNVIQSNSAYQINITDLPRGAYFLQLNNNEQRIIKKVIKL
jgi:hypothetical protein